MSTETSGPELQDQRRTARGARAAAIAAAGGIQAARESGTLPRYIDATVSELLVLGLLAQGVRTFLAVFGHGSTEVGEVLRIYQEAGLVRVYGLRSELEASHAAAALRWLTGEKAAVVTSIGPGALQALAASLVAAADGLGVWYLLGDETTEDEGPNMQQIPRAEQSLFLKLYSTMGQAYSLHTPWALPTALRRGLNTVDHPHRGGPFFLLMPMNVQPIALQQFNLDELPTGAPPPLGAAAETGGYERAAAAIRAAERIVVRVGGGATGAGAEIQELLDLVDGVAVVAPIALGAVPHQHPRNMTVGGSKGSLSGNYAMEEADLLIAIGSRAVCQADCSRTGYPRVQHVININTDLHAAMHYGKTTALIGDAAPTIRRLLETLRASGVKPPAGISPWMAACARKRARMGSVQSRPLPAAHAVRRGLGREVLTQPAAIKAATDWVLANGAVGIFDAGDVQANGFQIAEPDRPGQFISEAGASYMGFGVSALLATAVARRPFYGVAFSGDGSFTMNPQILIDGVQHGARGCILLFDNRRMAAISGLQMAQYGRDYATNDSVAVDYVAWAKAVQGVKALHSGYSLETLRAALDEAFQHPGLSLIHIPVYYGENELGGMGVFGRWNVGNWSEDTQALRHRIGL